MRWPRGRSIAIERETSIETWLAPRRCNTSVGVRALVKAVGPRLHVSGVNRDRLTEVGQRPFEEIDRCGQYAGNIVTEARELAPTKPIEAIKKMIGIGIDGEQVMYLRYASSENRAKFFQDPPSYKNAQARLAVG